MMLRTGKARAYAEIELLKAYRFYLGDGSDDLTKEQEQRALDLMTDIEEMLGIRMGSGRAFDCLMDFWRPLRKIDAVEKHRIQLKCEHRIQVKCAIKSPGNIHNAHRQTKHWAAHWIQENNVKIQVTTKSIVFWITGAGSTLEEADKNANDHAEQVRKGLEHTYNCLLGDPEFKDETSHYQVKK